MQVSYALWEKLQIPFKKPQSSHSLIFHSKAEDIPIDTIHSGNWTSQLFKFPEHLRISSDKGDTIVFTYHGHLRSQLSESSIVLSVFSILEDSGSTHT